MIPDCESEVVVNNINDVFSPFLAEILMHSTHSTRSLKRPVFSRSKKDMFTFTIADGLSTLGSRMNYSDLAQSKALLQRFLDARLLHFPENRTSSNLKMQRSSTLLQPTPKGLAFLQKWFYIHGKTALTETVAMSAVVTALESDYNTMELVELERSFLDGKILVSIGVVMLLWVHMLGTDPHMFDLETLEATFGSTSTSEGENSHLYGGHNGDPGPANLSRALKSTSVFNATMLATKNMFCGDSKQFQAIGSDKETADTLVSEITGDQSSHIASLSHSTGSDTDLASSPSETENEETKHQWEHIVLVRADDEIRTVVSPYYHRSMMHPNSKALMQYWDSRGIRLFKNVKFERGPKSKLGKPVAFKVSHVFSGNSMLQWVMDCTNVESISEGVSVTMLLLQNRFVKPIVGDIMDLTAVPSTACSRDNHIPAKLSAHALYRLTPRGRHLCVWNDEIPQSVLDEQDIEDELRESTNRLNQQSELMAAIDQTCGTSSEEEAMHSGSRQDLFSPQTWAWEHQLPGSVSQLFVKITDLFLIFREPALKMLFRQDAAKAQCVESVLCVDSCQNGLQLLSAVQDASQTVTRRHYLEAEIINLMDELESHFLTEGGSLELNLSQDRRDALKSALRSAHDLTVSPVDAAQRLVKSLTELRMLATELLRDVVGRFVNGDIVYRVPKLRSYIVARYAKARLN